MSKTNQKITEEAIKEAEERIQSTIEYMGETFHLKKSKEVFDLILQLTEYLHPIHKEELSMEDLIAEMQSVVDECKEE